MVAALERLCADSLVDEAQFPTDFVILVHIQRFFHVLPTLSSIGERKSVDFYSVDVATCQISWHHFSRSPSSHRPVTLNLVIAADSSNGLMFLKRSFFCFAIEDLISQKQLLQFSSFTSNNLSILP